MDTTQQLINQAEALIKKERLKLILWLTSPLWLALLAIVGIALFYLGCAAYDKLTAATPMDILVFCAIMIMLKVYKKV